MRWLLPSALGIEIDTDSRYDIRASMLMLNLHLRRPLPCNSLICYYHVHGHGRGANWNSHIYKAGVTVVATFILGTAVLYKQIQLVRRRMKLTTEVFQTEKRSSYIYVKPDDVPDGVQSCDVHTSWTWRARERTKKGLWVPWLKSRILSYDPWTLLRLAKSDEQSVRLLGVRALSEQHSWNDAQYQTVAQALDSRTLVGLARSSGADRRFFLPMPTLKPTDMELKDELRNLVSSLTKEGVDTCTADLCKNAMKLKQTAEEKTTVNDDVWLFDTSGSTLDSEVQETEVTPKTPSLKTELACLRALLALSRTELQCKEMVHYGGLSTLQRVYESRSDKRGMTECVARILANVSRHCELRSAIITAGWVSVLAGWMRSADLALCQHATKTLHHLDVDEDQSTYVDSVYLYYPTYRQRMPICADIIFVHGLMGGPFKTWRQRDPDTQTDKNSTKQEQPLSDWSADRDKQDVDTAYTRCWPRDWLSKDCPHTRILTVEYDTRLTDWPRRTHVDLSHKRSILSRSASLLSKLQDAGVGQRPVIWVGHSMGGLLIKQMLLLAADDNTDIVNATRGIIFYSVPHQGSPVATSSRHTKYVFHPSIEVQELKEGSQQLESLQREFKDLALKCSMPIVSFCEGQKCQLPFNIRLMLVPPRCSDAEMGTHYVMTDLSHMTICKPDGRNSRLYQLTRDFILDCLPPNPTAITSAHIHFTDTQYNVS